MKTITTPNFKSRAVNIIEAVLSQTRIDQLSEEVLKELLQDALEEGYYDGYDSGYYEGRSDGYDAGHYDGYEDAFFGTVAYKRPRQPQADALQLGKL